MNTTAALPTTALEALKLIATAQFRPFTDTDWMGFAGCETADPQIAELGDLTIIIDGDELTFNMYSEEGELEWTNFKLNFLSGY
jgi:hypothetical protein